MTAPNNALKAVRQGLLMSQDDLARAIGATKRQVQRWEAGQTAAPRGTLARSLEKVTGLPLSHLGFTIDIPGADVDNGQVAISGGAVAMPAGSAAVRSNFTGIWLSRYEYHSSSLAATLEAKHFVVLLQHDNRLTVRSLPGGSTNPDSPLTMDLVADGNIVTGTWVEQTAKDGRYRGAVYHGAVQMLVEPTGRRMRGKWVGFGSEMDINTGPWELVFQSASTAKAAMEAYSRVPD